MGEQQGDRCKLLKELGVQTAKNVQLQEKKSSGESYETGYYDVDRRDSSLDRQRNNNCCSQFSHTWGNVVAAGVVVAIVLSSIAIVLTVNNSSELQDVRQQLAELSKLCNPTKQSDGDGVANDNTVGARGRDRDGALSWRQNADLPSDSEDDIAGLGPAGGDWNQVSTSRELYGDDDEEEDETTEDEDDDELEAEAEGILHRSRRNADSEHTTKKPRKNKNKNKRRHHRDLQEKNGPCKKYDQCKNMVNGKGKKNKKCKRKTLDILKTVNCMLKDPDAPAACPTGCPTPSPPSGASFTSQAVHFMSDFWEGLRQEEFGKEKKEIVRKDAPLKFLKPAEWMNDQSVYKDKSEWPIQPDGKGGFDVIKSGLYLIYSSVMFHDIKPRQSQAVVVNGHKLFKCMDSVDYIDTDLPSGNNQAKYKTCAMTGVTHLKAGNRLEVQNLYANTEIDLSTDATYFGAVLMSPGEVSTKTT